MGDRDHKTALFEQFADNHVMTAYGDATRQLLDLLKASHMEEHVKWFFLLGGLGRPTTTNEPREFQPATLGSSGGAGT